MILCQGIKTKEGIKYWDIKPTRRMMTVDALVKSQGWKYKNVFSKNKVYIVRYP